MAGPELELNMGMEIATTSSQEPKPIDESDVGDLRVLTTRPSILLVGPPAVGKRSLLNRVCRISFPGLFFLL